MVREEDVLNYLGRATPTIPRGSNLHPALEGISLEGLTFPAIFSDQDGARVAPEFLAELSKKPDSFLNLSSDEKCQLYRSHGAEIGEDVQIGKGTLIFAPRIQLGDRVRIGESSSIHLRERFAAGHLSSFREGLSVRGGTAVFGTNTFAGSHIRIGGGGNADPWALLVVGDGVYLGDDLFINICRPVLIGKEVFLTQRSILVTHNIGHSILEGYENAFAPVVLEDFSQVGMNTTLYAGSRVGHSAIVASNSYVISSIPKGKLAMGVPAVVVRDAARSISRSKQVQIAASMLRQFCDLLKLKGVAVSEFGENPILHFNVTHDGKIYRIAFIESVPATSAAPTPVDESVVWTLDSSCGPYPSGVTLMDLLAKTCSGPCNLFADSAREFLRKRGIRLEPGPWRYQKGLI
jgi:acetyltransferase-like isoleucine patch superfamily enzyme